MSIFHMSLRMISIAGLLAGGLASANSPSVDYSGKWSWKNHFDGRTGEMTLNADGSCTATMTKESCRWKLDGRYVVIFWNQMTKSDRLILSEDGSTLTGSRQANPKVRLEMKRVNPYAGRWGWKNNFDGQTGEMTLNADGSCTATMTKESCNWKLDGKNVVIFWNQMTKFDRFTSSEDGSTLTGSPQANPDIKLEMRRQ